jgi:putative transposase
MVNIEKDIWHWYHNISECYYHIQLTIKYRKSLFKKETEDVIIKTMKDFKERYAIEINHVGFDQNHVHFLLRFLPKYSGGQVIRLLKSISSKALFEQVPAIKKELWNAEFWTDGYYISTVSGRGSKQVIEKYIINQGRDKDVKQLRLFSL